MNSPSGLARLTCWAKRYARRWPVCQRCQNHSSLIRRWRSCVFSVFIMKILNKQPQIRQIRQADGQPLTGEQSRILEAQLRTQRELLNSLLQGAIR